MRADEGRESGLLDECYFLSNIVIVDHCFHNIWWLLKEPFFDLRSLTALEVRPKPSQGARSSRLVPQLFCGVLAP